MSTEFTAQMTKQKTYFPNDINKPWRWILTHLQSFPLLAIGAIFFSIAGWSLFALSPVVIGRIAQVILSNEGMRALVGTTVILLIIHVVEGLATLSSNICAVTLSHKFERDARAELYQSLLGKSQTYHNRQRVGDLVARATEDVRRLKDMFHPGMIMISDMLVGFASPLVYITILEPTLLLVPGIYTIIFTITVRAYVKRIGPIIMSEREQYGHLTAKLEETLSGIETIKVAVQETWERKRFYSTATLFRNFFVKVNRTEAIYYPMLAYGICMALSLLHGFFLLSRNNITTADLISFAGLMLVFRIPTFISAFSFSLVQNGLAGAKRILMVMAAKTNLDQNIGGHEAIVHGSITIKNISFGYSDKKIVLKNINLSIDAGETVALVGQTGSGKSTLTQLINRTYDPSSGQLDIDGIDIRKWNIASLRSQIANIEQDVFLFSRTISENIAFSRQNASSEEIKLAAQAAAADQFIESFQDGYNTKIGERGVTLSGGQRQRLAIARAFLKDPRILILDDSTSAIDSETEDQIQHALKTIQKDRTTIIITHRLSQIRWADRIVVMVDGSIAASGTHESLLATSEEYRRIFSRYEITLPPLEINKGKKVGNS